MIQRLIKTELAQVSFKEYLKDIRRHAYENNLKVSYNTKEQKLRLRKTYDQHMRQEIYINDIYQVNVDRYAENNCDIRCDLDIGLIWISFKRLDKEKELMDYDILMEIKKQIVGEEYQAIMILPPKSQEVDGANQYHYFVACNKETRHPLHLPIGLDTLD